MVGLSAGEAHPPASEATAPEPDDPPDALVAAADLDPSTAEPPAALPVPAPDPTPSTVAPTLEPPRRAITSEVIDPDDPSVLFFSGNEDCDGIERSQRHPDWVEGQANDSRNADGTPTYGFAYNTGDSTAGEIDWRFVPSDLALGGDCVLAMSINDAYDERRAIRIFRRYDRHGDELPEKAFYSVWFYFPQDISYDTRATIDGSTVYGYWNVFQIKNKVDGQSLANLSINAGKVTGADSMSFSIWRKSLCGPIEECDAAHSIEQLDPIAIPTGRWVHFELYLEASTGSDGRVMAWQDGYPIIDFAGQTERTGTERRNWSVNNYGRLHRPASHTLYVDDVLIATAPVHPRLFAWPF